MQKGSLFVGENCLIEFSNSKCTISADIPIHIHFKNRKTTLHWYTTDLIFTNCSTIKSPLYEPFSTDCRFLMEWYLSSLEMTFWHFCYMEILNGQFASYEAKCKLRNEKVMEANRWFRCELIWTDKFEDIRRKIAECIQMYLLILYHIDDFHAQILLKKNVLFKFLTHETVTLGKHGQFVQIGIFQNIINKFCY